MNTHDERYVLSIAASHKAVRLRDHQTGEIHEWTGTRALYDALGVLAEWRERDANAHKAHYGVAGDGRWHCRTHGRPYGECAGANTDGMPCAASPDEHRNPDYARDYAVPEIKCSACGVTGGMPHDCETSGRIS